MRAFHFEVALTVVLLGVGPALAQRPERSERGGPPPMGGAFDPTRIFESMDASGDGLVTRDELRGRRDQDRFDDYVRRAGVTDGRLTRELFLKAFQQRMEERMSNVRSYSFVNPQEMFRNYDRNNDGKLDQEEIRRTSRLRTQVERWDSNRDESIDKAEFTAFVEQLMGPPAGQLPSARDGSNAETKPEGEKPAEPRMHYRAGKLPPNIQEWFKELDGDDDGQVGLYEWKGRETEEFTRFDRNGDGFITIEEAEHALNRETVKPDG